MHYLLFYNVVDNYVERRASFRAAHLTLARWRVRAWTTVVGPLAEVALPPSL